MTYTLLLAMICYVSLVESSQHSVPIKDYYGRDVILHYDPIGCFNDHYPQRALRNWYYDARTKVLNWYRWPKTFEDVAKACAVQAYQKGYTGVFGVQFYGECWSDGSALARFAKYGRSKYCILGVGQNLANFVYRLSVSPKTAPRTKGAPSTCHINGKVYEENDIIYIPNDWSDDVANAKCKRCKCRNGQAKDCVIIQCEIGQGGLCSKYKNDSNGCCPVCDCYHNGQVMQPNSTWTVRNKKKECSLCTCGQNGIATCTARSICVCFGEEIPVPGQCCPKCVPKTTAATTVATEIIPTEPTHPPFPPPP